MRLYRPRHAVWIDVFGVVLVGALLFGGAGYLLTHAERGGGGRLGDGDGRGRALSEPRRARRPSSPHREFSSRTGGRSLSGRRAEPTGEEAAVPFSASWRKEATPELTAPSPSSGGAGGAAEEGGWGEGPAIASAQSGRSLGAVEDQRDGTGRSERGGWWAEARQLGKQARALSNALGRRGRNGTGGAGKSTSSEAGRAAGPSESNPEASGAPGLPSSPDPVPIGDHLHWLAAAGLAWGIWRLGRGA